MDGSDRDHADENVNPKQMFNEGLVRSGADVGNMKVDALRLPLGGDGRGCGSTDRSNTLNRGPISTDW
jgi:hypothetical protein